MKVALLAMAALSAMLAASPAHAAGDNCKITALIAPGVSATYDPFDATFNPSPIPISVQTKGNGCNGAKVELALVPTAASPSTGTQARLVQGGSVMLATVLAAGQPRPIVSAGAAFSSNPLLLTVGSTGTISGDATLAINLHPGQVGNPGVYVANLMMVARLTDQQGSVSEANTPVNLSVTVQPSVRLAAGAGQLSIDLGELKPGVSGGPVSFDAYANVNYVLMLSSDNGFTMRRGGTGASPGVPYTPVLSNGTITVASTEGGTSRRQAIFNAPNDGIRRHSLSVRVDSFSNLGAGDYSDVMTLEIRARV